MNTTNLSYQNLRTIMLANKHQFFDNGNFNLNLIFFRNTQFSDKYDDVLYIAYKDNLVEKVFTCPVSTEAGSYYFKLNPFKLNSEGVAVKKEGQNLRSYEYRDNFLGQPYLHLIKEIELYRDGNKNTHIDKSIIRNVNAGTHIHVGGDIKGIVYNWSAGCTVIPKQYYAEYIKIIQRAVQLHGKIFSETIIENY